MRLRFFLAYRAEARVSRWQSVKDLSREGRNPDRLLEAIEGSETRARCIDSRIEVTARQEVPHGLNRVFKAVTFVLNAPPAIAACTDVADRLPGCIHELGKPFRSPAVHPGRAIGEAV